MKKLLDQAVKLNNDLTIALQEANTAKAESNQLSAKARIELDKVGKKSEEVSRRESDVLQKENVHEVAAEARRLKAENVAECSKIEKASTELANKEKAFASKQAKATADLNTREADVNAERDENRKIREALKVEKENMRADIIAELQGK